jgi:hypothetical protein
LKQRKGKGRKTSKERRAIQIRFDTDPKIASKQREKLDRNFKKSGLKHRNDYILQRVLA